MKKLSEQLLTAKADLETRLEDAIEAIIAAVQDLNDAIDDYNAILETDAVAFRDDVVGAMQAHIDSMEAAFVPTEEAGCWSNTDAGEAYEDWMGSYALIDVEPMSHVDVDGLDDGLKEELENLDEELTTEEEDEDEEVEA